MDTLFSVWMSAGENGFGSTTQSETRPESTVSPHLFDARGQFLHKVVHSSIGPNHVRDLRVRVQDGRVVAIAEVLPDLGERRIGQFTGQVHRDLARVDDVLRALVAAELVE